jgi:uncharacterized protein YcsI (UPF0317 family)
MNVTTPIPTTGRAARLYLRQGRYRGTTAAMAPGYVQGNLVILPREPAWDFLQFCQRNPKPCPVLGVSEPGDPHLPQLGQDLDIRTDLPLYRVWRDGRIAAEVPDILDLWQADLVGFVLGCSFSFDHALMAEGIALRYIDEGTPAPAFVTSIPTAPAGRFHGPLVVSMRPLKPADAIRAIQISSRFPGAHGAPIHLGSPQRIGIKNLNQPEFGSPVAVNEDEIPVFWACGATPQAVVAASALPFCITHAAATMLVTDLRLGDLAIF